MQQQKIIVSSSAEGLNKKIAEHLAEGWEPMGAHQVITRGKNVLYQGQRTQYENEYSQTVRINHGKD